MSSMLRRSGGNAGYACLVLGFGILFTAADAIAADPLVIVRIEEDWELVVASPDANSTAPQVTCVISPWRDVDSLHAAFELNHHSQPDFTSGGLQLQLWDDEYLVNAASHPSDAVLSNDKETIRWTQAMELSAGRLAFEISGGSSTTWGAFGGDGSLQVSVPTTLTSLNGYSPTTSVHQSGIGYAANRVVTLSLKRVRVTLKDGTVLEEATTRTVHSLN